LLFFLLFLTPPSFEATPVPCTRSHLKLCLPLSFALIPRNLLFPSRINPNNLQISLSNFFLGSSPSGRLFPLFFSSTFRFGAFFSSFFYDLLTTGIFPFFSVSSPLEVSVPLLRMPHFPAHPFLFLFLHARLVYPLFRGCFDWTLPCVVEALLCRKYSLPFPHPFPFFFGF